MKKQLIHQAICLTIFVFAITFAHATNYYFSSTDGDDGRTNVQAQSSLTPWKSLVKLNAIFANLHSGDSIFFKRGNIFYGSISASASGTATAPIVFTSYGSGQKPVISGLTQYQTWTSLGNNIWQTDVASSLTELNVVLLNDNFQSIGRFPNAVASNGGYLSVENFSGNSSITSSSLASGANWNGGDIVIRKNRWILDRSLITNHSSNTISYVSGSGYHATSGYGFFIQNHAATLDVAGEWYFKNAKLGVYLNGSPSSQKLEASTVPVLVTLNNKTGIAFSGLEFRGANTYAFDIKNSHDISITDCSVLYSGVNAFEASNSQNLRIESSAINYSNNIALNLTNCSGAMVKNNAITNSGAIAGMGKSGDGTYEGVLISGNNYKVEGNTIENTGYIPVSFNGSNVSIKNNIIKNFTLVKDDGGGIYTWNNSYNPPVYTNRQVIGNIVLNGRSSGKGTTENDKKFSHGIYLDDNAANVEVRSNTIADCEGFGIFVHNAKDNSLVENTVYNNTVQIALIHDDIAPNYPIRNTLVKDNIFFSLLASQTVAEYKSRANDISDFGTFQNNYYARPLNDNATIGILKNVNGVYSYQLADVEGWQALYGKDAGSKASPKTIIPYTVTGVIGANQYSNGSFTNNIGGLYAFSPANNCQASWNANALDGGSLAVNFSGITNSSKGTVIIGAGAVSAGRKYILRFTVKASDEQKMLDLYLRKSGSPYNDVTERKLVKLKAARQEVELLFTASETTADASIGIDVPEQSSPVYFDNILVREVSATDINVADSVKFFYNPTLTTQSNSLTRPYIDVKGTNYSNNVSTTPFSSVVLIAGQATVVAPPPTQVTCSATGSILREQWNGIDGNDIVNIPQLLLPSLTSQLTSFEGPLDAADRYGSRIRGYVCPPLTGNYSFWIAGDDATELWLSTDDNPALKTRIAYSLSWTGFRDWNRYPTQKSASIYLTAGKKYYIEALQKEGGGGDHLSVSWQLPNGVMEAPIAGSRLSPFQVTTPLTNQTISFAAPLTFVLGNAPLTLTATASSGLPVSIRVVSGPATLSGAVLTATGIGIIVVEATQAGNTQYNAAPAVIQSITVVAQPTTVVCSATGSIMLEQWNGVSGSDVSQIPVSSVPSLTNQLSSFEVSQSNEDSYGRRIRGYICPPQTGNYIFSIAGDDATELWLSTDDNPVNKFKIAYSLAWTYYREFTRYSTQKSASIYLTAGKKYYIEALQKEGNGGDHLSVAWQKPGGEVEAPIDGSRLSPYQPVVSTACNATGYILREQWNNIEGNDVSNIPIQTTPSSSSFINQFEGASGMADRYGSRISGYVCAPQTGYYTFWIAGDDATELWLSTSDNPAAKTKIAYSLSWTNNREWNRFPSQKSASMYLEAGKKYYIEALQKEGVGGDHLSVAWEIPNIGFEAPIAGRWLSPYSANSARLTTSSVSETVRTSTEKASDKIITCYPNPFWKNTTIEIGANATGRVVLEIYDAAGSNLKTLFKGLMYKGARQKFTWDGATLSAGIYFVRYTSATETVMYKIVKE